MADNTVLSTGSGGDTIRTEEKGSAKTQIVMLDVGGTGATESVVGDSGVGVPVKGLGTAGTANSAVVTVQGIASMTPIQVGDNSASLTVDNAGTFAVQVDNTVTVASHAVTNAGTFAVQDSEKVADNAGFTDGTTKVQPSGYIFDEVAGTALTENDAAAARIDSKRAQVLVIEDETTRGRRATVTAANALKVDASGMAVPITDNSGSITVDNGGTFAVQATVAAGATNIAKAEDVASADADVGVPAMAVRKATPANTSGTDGDYEMLQMSAGRLWVDASGVTLTVGSHAVTNAGTFAVQAASAGDVAHDAADSGNPVKTGGKATTSQSGLTLVADADRTDARYGIDGFVLNRPHTNLESIVTGNASNTDGTSTQCIAAQTSGIKTYLTSIILTNTSSSMIYVEIKDGTTVKLTIPVPASGGAIFNPPVPLPGTAATAWNFDPSAATTTVYCSMIGFTSKV